MGEVLLFFVNLSLGEFLIVWMSIVMIVIFYVILLYQFNQVKKDTESMKLRLDQISVLLANSQKIDRFDEKFGDKS